MHYPRYLIKERSTFDPIELARVTESIVCKHINGVQLRKYDDFYVVWVYNGVATGYVVGCNLRCYFCWSYISRDFPERYGTYYSPEEVVTNLRRLVKEYGVDKVRISGGEPTVSRDHLLQVLELVEQVPEIKLFLLETNGILLGHDEGYVRKLAQFRKILVRVSLKAGTPEKFSERTGAKPEFFELPFRAIRHLLKYGVPVYVAAMTDPRLMSNEERLELMKKLAEIDPDLVKNLEEESVDPYETTLLRLEAAQVNIPWESLEF
ncbi:MAG: molybdenum cofactor biosynthesis protein MoaA [Thermoprotei archaeon]|nr:MAG: molybdenum cofactor biosynthesis protein MoaA [Thermoprotei archaeon]